MATVHPPGRILAQHLITLGLGTATQTADWSIQLNNISYETSPAKKIGIYTTFSRVNAELMETGQTLAINGIQLVVRADKDENAYEKIHAISIKLDEIKNNTVAVEGVSYVIKSFSTTTPPFFFKQEEKDLRRFYALNGYLNYEEIK